ncbi:MAG: polyamine aminopropyltransferase, partial [Gemmatimonadetes bacterium]
MAPVLLTSVLLIAACGLVYELVAGALASYLLGDSVTQFSTVIGTYLCAMGVGSWLSRHIGRGLVARFVTVELLVALVGGYSATALFLAFAYTGAFRLVLYTLVAIIGVFVGLEIPLLMRILRDRFTFKDVVANVLTFDYLGALGASIAFPILLVPHLGLVRAALLFGLVNAAVALWSTILFRRQLGAPRLLVGVCVIVLGLLAAGMAGANRITELTEDNLYADDVILAKSSRYQRIVLTAWKNDLRLFLNGHLQFSSRDEYRYHEALVHPGLAAVPGARRILILGGGDGLAAREVLRYPGVESVTLVDLDPVMTQLFATHPVLTPLNARALTSPKLHIVNADAFVWLETPGDPYDFVIVDFPDPSSYNLGKLYTTAFYRLAAKHLSRGGFMVVQSTSPLFAPRSFWCIARTIAEAGLHTYPYHVY